MPTAVEIVTWLFVATNACRMLAYFPQIVAALKCQNGATAVSRATWSYFALAHLTGVFYSRLVLHDSKMATVLLGNFVACVTLVSIVSWKKARHRAGLAVRLAEPLPARVTTT
jgi:NAD/NADP transhydrogenase beta subunit